jgi:hypothetical protein
MIRAGAIAAYRGGPPARPALPHDGSRSAGALREERLQLTHGHGNGTRSERSLRPDAAVRSQSLVHRLGDQAQGARAAKAVSHGACVDALLAGLGFAIDTRYLDSLRDDDEDRPVKAGEALDRLMVNRTRLGEEMRKLERALRERLDRETKRLEHELAGGDAVAAQTIRDAANEVHTILPVLMLLPGGQLEVALDTCLKALEAAAGTDTGLRESDHRLQAQMRELQAGLAEEKRDTYESWAAVGDHLASYDEPRPTLTVVGRNS